MGDDEKKYTVLYLIWSLGLGGAERVVVDLANHLDRKRFRLIVCCLNEPGEFAGTLKKDVPLYAIRKRPFIDVSVIPKLVRIMRTEKVDVLHAHLWGANFWGRIAAVLAGVPVRIVTEHNEDVWKNRFHFFCDRVLSWKTDCFVAVSGAVAEFYRKRAGVPSCKIHIIHNGIEVGRFRSHQDVSIKRRELGIPEDCFLFSIIGRIEPQKGHRFMLQAMARVKARYPKIALLVVGEGSRKSELEQESRKEVLDIPVLFSGIRQDVPEILNCVDALVLPSTREGFPIILLEAMAAGKPIIASNVGGVSECIGSEEEGGILVPPGDVKALTETMRRVLEDRTLCERLAKKSRQRVKDLFPVEIMIAKTEKLYLDLLSVKQV